MLTNTFGEALFIPGSECLSEFPSPESMKRRVIISTKPPKEYLQNKNVKDNDDGIQKAKESPEEEAWGKEIPDLDGPEPHKVPSNMIYLTHITRK